MTIHNQIVSKLLETQKTHPLIGKYLKLINNDVFNFLNNSELKNGISTYNRLLKIADELSLIHSIPQAFYHHKIAVAGGFSAGKSEFISSFFKHNKAHLASGIEPTTAIPTYIMHNKDNQTEVFAKKTLGGSGIINLTAIDKDIHLKLSHNFLNEFGFNIKTIMPQMYFSTPLEFEHICFIDTPGYNPSNTGNGITQEDNQTALDFVNQSESLIWLIGLDSNGTISKSDLNFLEKIQNESPEKKIYIVLNKADLRPLTNIQDVMEEVINTLEDYDIEFDGISAYSSIERREIDYFKKTLFEFINERNAIKNRIATDYYMFNKEINDLQEQYFLDLITKQLEEAERNSFLSIRSYQSKLDKINKDKNLIIKLFKEMQKVLQDIFMGIRKTCK